MHENIEHLRGHIELHEADITSAERILGVFEEIKPHAVFHLAAESFVPTSFREPVRVSHNNIVGTLKIFEAAKRFNDGLESVQVACSSEQYGLVDPNEVPVTEDIKKNPFRPRSVYGITKCATEQIAWLYHNSYGVPSIITRGFNHEGPRRGIQFVTSVIHRQIVEILKGKRDKIVIGNPNAIRDFTHVKDTVNAYTLLSEKRKLGEPFNVCSGMGITIADYVKLAKKIYNLDTEVFIDPKRMRPSEVPLLIGRNEKIFNETGWKPIRSVIDIIKEGVEYFKAHPEMLGIEAH
jgi:GDP-4-dehydro-6-deoxy-D-mannose reductase